MRHSFSDDAIVLRTYDVGETDRFCILLTRKHGRLSARAKGARRLTSRKGGSLLPLHIARVDIEAKGDMRFVAGAASVNANASSWQDFAALAAAERAIELLLKLIDEGQPVEDVYALTEDFLRACNGQRADDMFAIFTLKLLDMLGMMPSLTHSSVSHRSFGAETRLTYNPATGALSAHGEDAKGIPVSPELLSLLRSLPTRSLSNVPTLPPSVTKELRFLAHSLLGNQLGAELRTLPVPPGATPI